MITVGGHFDDFGVMCEDIEDAKHLEGALKAHHPVKSDWQGEKHIVIDLAWNYSDTMSERQLATSVKGYVKKALHQFQHDSPSKPEHSPSKSMNHPTVGRRSSVPLWMIPGS